MLLPRRPPRTTMPMLTRMLTLTRMLALVLLLTLTLVLTLTWLNVHVPLLRVNALTVPTVLSSHMVLQAAPQASRVWGSATPSTPVWVTLATNSTANTYNTYKAGTFADPLTGNWTIDLPPQPASLVTYTLTIAGDNTTLTFDDVLFGEVWFCSGQSNMEFSLNDTFGGPEAVNASSDYPYLRMFVQQRISSFVPLYTTVSRNPNTDGWAVSSPMAVDGPSFYYISAICYLHGRNLFHALGGQTPVGLVQSSWSGSWIEAWMSPDAYPVCPFVPGIDVASGGRINAGAGAGVVVVADDEEDDASIEDVTPNVQSRLSVARSARAERADRTNRVGLTPRLGDGPHIPSSLWNGMLVPFLPLRFRGFAWYQGEENHANYTSYACRFPVFIQDLRSKFDSDFPFYFILLAPHLNDSTWPYIREAQLHALTLPLVHVASAQDAGDPASPFGNIHSRNKSIVAGRLTDAVLSQTYLQTEVQWQGPSVVDVVWPISNAPLATVLLRLDPTDVTSKGLHLLDTAECTACCASIEGSPIMLGLSDGSMVRAQVQLLSDVGLIAASIDLGANATSVSVVGVYQGWEFIQQCAIYNQAVLPMLPFRLLRD